MFADPAAMTIWVRQAGLAAFTIAFAGVATTLLPPWPAALAIWSLLAVGR